MLHIVVEKPFFAFSDSLLGAKLPLVYVRMIAGHSDINTTARVYFHANEDIIAKEVHAAEFNGLSEPAKMGSSFVSKTIMPLIESSSPKMIEEELRTNNFMSCSREVTMGQKREWVENGMNLPLAFILPHGRLIIMAYVQAVNVRQSLVAVAAYAHF